MMGQPLRREATRDYVISTEAEGQSLLINIFGGKITTYRKLSESIVEHIENFLGKKKPAWTDQSLLPGGDVGVNGPKELGSTLHSRFPFLERHNANRLARLYGTNAEKILYNLTSLDELGQDFGCGLYQAEVEYLIENEWALTAEDILYRRTKLGIVMGKIEVAKLELF